MALSQYVAINFLTKFDKKGLERATKELKGFDKFVATGAYRLKAFGKAGSIAAVAGLAIFTKKSIEAALAQEKLDKQLQLSLRSINEEFALPSIKTFIAQLQSATNITEEQLVPAFRQLISQTGDLQSAQVLLTKALDVSAGTGADLDTVINAISKAAVGNYKSIAALGIGFTAAEAKSMGFVKVMQSLERFAGAAEDQTKTFAGGLKGFKIAAGEATETLGEGFLTFISIITTGSDQLDIFNKKLEKGATQFRDIFVGTAVNFEKKGLGAYLDILQIGIQGVTGDLTYAGNKLQQIEKQGTDQRIKRTLIEQKLYGLSGGVLDALTNQNKSGKKQLTYAELLAQIQKDILARSKALTKEQLAQQALDKKKSELAAMFDIDRINLQAALSRKLNAEDELRVRILQKLADGTKAAVDEAQRYADVLKVIEDGQITTGEIEMLAKKWGITTTEVLLYLRALFNANEELRKMLALLDELMKKKMPTQQTGGMYAPGYFQELGRSLVGTPGYTDMTAAQISAERYKESGAALRGIPFMADGGVVNQPTLAMIGESGSEAVIPLDKLGNFATTVNINVAGSVISEGQLQSVIQDALYNLNRSGAVSQLQNLGR